MSPQNNRTFQEGMFRRCRCSSYVGMIGGTQPFTLKQECRKVGGTTYMYHTKGPRFT